MFDIYFVVFILIYAIGCFIEFFVFNEEILLSLCFLSFVFFCFNTLSDSVAENFTSSANKLESDLLLSYSHSKSSLMSEFNYFIQSRGSYSKFKILLSSIVLFLINSKQNSITKLSSSFFSIAFAKLNELVIFENTLLEKFQTNCIMTLLYPFVFQSVGKTSIALSDFKPKTISTSTYAPVLKALSF